jgi:predicted unusual protein kinase regulating ubiquinone biosynthesis (AarF/ABC1/UbiB family)
MDISNLKKIHNQIQELREKADKTDSKKETRAIDKEIEAVQSRMPGFDDIKLRKEDTDFLLTEYQKVFIEQFHKVDKNGKIIHADIHPGNIFIDPEVLKTRKGKLFTLIDTGNMIDMGVEQSMRALNFSKYVQQGNVKDIAAFVLDGAKLPKGMSEKDAVDKVVKELETCFFDNKTKIGMLDDEKVLTLTDNIMQKYDIIPSSTQLNLNKSRTSARNSLNELQSAIIALDGI